MAKSRKATGAGAGAAKGSAKASGMKVGKATQSAGTRFSGGGGKATKTDGLLNGAKIKGTQRNLGKSGKK